MVTCCYGNRPWNRLRSWVVEILLPERQREVRKKKRGEEGEKTWRNGGKKVKRKSSICVHVSTSCPNQALTQLACHQKCRSLLRTIFSDQRWQSLLLWDFFFRGFRCLIMNMMPHWKKGGSSLIDIHLTRLMAVYSKHYITTVMADGWHHNQTQLHSLTVCFALPIFVRTN